MKFEAIQEAVRGIPFISDLNARLLYDLIVEHELRDLLELGFAHGVATCFMAGALDEIGGGSLTCVDLRSQATWQQPSVEELLGRIGLTQHVRIERMHTGYTWFLHDEIRRNSSDGQACRPAYDLCIIDGPKNWTIDGAAFFMVDKLLRPNGRLILDDVDWTYARSAHSGRQETDGVNHELLSPDELRTPQIREVCELLVMQHPDYRDFRFTDTDWFMARKSTEGELGHARVVETVYLSSPADVLRRGVTAARRFVRRH